AELISARSPYKQGCLVYDRDPREIHPPLIEGDFSFSPDPEWVRILEFYCSGCGVQIETEYLPPGHPVTVDIELDIDRLKRRLAAGEVRVSEGRLVPPDRGGGGRGAAGRPRPGGGAPVSGPTASQLNSVDIDVGGTFTDCVLTLDGRRVIGKAPTTPYDLSVGFMNAIEEVAAEAGLEVEE